MTAYIYVDPVCDGNTLPAQSMGQRISKKSKQEFADVLNGWLKRENLTQQQAADMLQMSVRTLQNWCIGRVAPRGVMRRMMLEQLRPPLPRLARRKRSKRTS